MIESLLSFALASSLAFTAAGLVGEKRRYNLRCQYESQLAELNKTLLASHISCEDSIVKSKSNLQDDLANAQSHIVRLHDLLEHRNNDLSIMTQQNSETVQSFNELGNQYASLEKEYLAVKAALDESEAELAELEAVREDNVKLSNEFVSLTEANQAMKNQYVEMANSANQEIARLQGITKTYAEALENTTRKNTELSYVLNGKG